MRNQERSYLVLTILLVMMVSVKGAIANCTTYVANDSTKCEACKKGSLPTLNQTACVINKVTNCKFGVAGNQNACA